MRMRFLLGRIPLIQSPKHKCDPRAVWNQWFRGAGVLCLLGRFRWPFIWLTYAARPSTPPGEGSQWSVESGRIF